MGTRGLIFKEQTEKFSFLLLKPSRLHRKSNLPAAVRTAVLNAAPPLLSDGPGVSPPSPLLEHCQVRVSGLEPGASFATWACDREGASRRLRQRLLACSCQLPAGVETRCPVPGTGSYGHSVPTGRNLGDVGKYRASLLSPHPPLIQGLALSSFIHSFIHSSIHSSCKHHERTWMSC